MLKLNALIEEFTEQVIAAIHNATVEDILGQPRSPERAPAPPKAPRTKRPAAITPRFAKEITDPEALLAASDPASSTPQINDARTRHRTTARRPMLPTVGPSARAALREGERVARATAAGVVIKRRPSGERAP